MGGDPVRPDARSQDLRDELRSHARAFLALGLPVRASPDAPGRRLALARLQEGEAGSTGSLLK